VAQVLECLPTKNKALSSNPNDQQQKILRGEEEKNLQLKKTKNNKDVQRKATRRHDWPNGQEAPTEILSPLLIVTKAGDLLLPTWLGKHSTTEWRLDAEQLAPKKEPVIFPDSGQAGQSSPCGTPDPRPT
jgi:hypothetical protein